MITFNYKLTNYKDYLQQLAALLGTTVANDTLLVPPSAGTGFCKSIILEDGPEALLYDFTLNNTLVLKRQPDPKEHYTLVFDELEQDDRFRVVIDTEEANNAANRTSAFYLTSFLYDIESVMHAGMHVKGIRISLSVGWMQQYLQLARNEAVLEKYIALKSAGIWYKPVNDELSTLLSELLNGQDMPLLFYQNRILRIVELFFEWLYDEMKVTAGKRGISRHDIEMAQKI